ncbi:hypothetical protein [Methylogaea oryzae]|nr:hypothetical protein [Methylogaea oryzae]
MAHFPLTRHLRPILHGGFLIAAAWLLVWAPPSAAAVEPVVEFFAPRDGRYVMGDSIEHTVAVTLPRGYVLESEFLPKPGAISDWLDLRRVDWDKENRGSEVRYRVRVGYRVFKGVRSAEKLAIPPLPLRFRGANLVEAQAPEWNFVLNPIIPPNTPDNQVKVRDGLAAPAIELGPHRMRLAALLAGVVAVLAHLARRYQVLALLFRKRGPFERAHRQLLKLARRSSDPVVYRQAFRVLHRALDETAGQTLLTGHLERFFRSQPSFVELRGELELFFARSQRLFFAVPAAPPPADYPFERLEALCLQCELLEKALRRNGAERQPRTGVYGPLSHQGQGEGSLKAMAFVSPSPQPSPAGRGGRTRAKQ